MWSSPSTDVLSKHVFFLVAAESHLNYLLTCGNNNKDAESSISLLRNSLSWLGGVTGSSLPPVTDGENKKELVALQARALYLSKMAKGGKNRGSVVPYLNYSAYNDVAENIKSVLITVNTKINEFQQRISQRNAR